MIAKLYQESTAVAAGVIGLICILLTAAGIDTPAQLWAAVQPITFAKIAMVAGAVWTIHFLLVAWMMRHRSSDTGPWTALGIAFMGLGPWIAYAIERSTLGSGG